MAKDLMLMSQSIIMKDERNDKEINERKGENDSLKPDPETLHKSDPQENMEGPVSSVMHKTGEAFEKTEESKKEADEKRDSKM